MLSSATHAFVREQPGFALQAACVPRQCATGADDAMTRQNDGDRVETVCSAHGTRRSRLADARGLLTVGCGLVYALP